MSGSKLAFALNAEYCIWFVLYNNYVRFICVEHFWWIRFNFFQLWLTMSKKRVTRSLVKPFALPKATDSDLRDEWWRWRLRKCLAIFRQPCHCRLEMGVIIRSWGPAEISTDIRRTQTAKPFFHYQTIFIIEQADLYHVVTHISFPDLFLRGQLLPLYCGQHNFSESVGELGKTSMFYKSHFCIPYGFSSRLHCSRVPTYPFPFCSHLETEYEQQNISSYVGCPKLGTPLFPILGTCYRYNCNRHIYLLHDERSASEMFWINLKMWAIIWYILFNFFLLTFFYKHLYNMKANKVRFSKIARLVVASLVAVIRELQRQHGGVTCSSLGHRREGAALTCTEK